MTTSEPKVCGSCGNRFGCGANTNGCWCADLTIVPEIAAELKLKYEDCLCPTCLNALAGQLSMIVTYEDGSTELIAGAATVDTQNFHEGMIDFYDKHGTLLKQISKSANIGWKIIDPTKI